MRGLLGVLILVLLPGCGGKGPEPGSPAWYAIELRNLRIRNMAYDLDSYVLTAGQLTEEQFARMEDFGFRTLVCLRPADEDGTGWEERIAANRKLRFVRIPIRGTEDLTRENAERLAAVLAGPGGDVVYCDTSDRVGALLALKRHLVDGRSAHEALSFGESHGLAALTDATTRILGRAGR